MAWWRRRRARVATGLDRAAVRETWDHLEGFVRSRRGVEAFLEPRTTVTETTMILIAHDGEWTRRRVPSAADARDWAHRLGVPVYDVALVGYPSRMREYNRRRREQA